MKATTAVLLLLPLLFGSFGCHRPEDPLVVNVVMVGNGTAFNAQTVGHRITTFLASGPKTASGRRIVVQEVFPSADMFAGFVAANSSVDIVIGDSPQQLAGIPALQQGAVTPANVCGANANCPALVAPWVPADKLETVKRVYAAIIGASAQ